MAKYRAILTQTASCVVEFEAPDDATPEELEAAMWDDPQLETPTLCHQCASSDRNQSLDIEGEWNVLRCEGKREITKIDD
ncbi:hypothetical protein [Streptomyces atriruber]|uniref:hypothetical protein n=1 Tax=Streptomyces atriruber TaxID=545121 RepID=UPI0006E16CDF|nr:hypothetical protein [Streptomyces atriruber]